MFIYIYHYEPLSRQFNGLDFLGKSSPETGGFPIRCRREYRESCTFSLNQPSEIWKITGFDPRPTVDLIAIDRVV